MCALAVQLFGVARLQLAGAPVLVRLLTPPVLAVLVLLAILFRPASLRSAARAST
jgi:hypothetical protein